MNWPQLELENLQVDEPFADLQPESKAASVRASEELKRRQHDIRGGVYSEPTAVDAPSPSRHSGNWIPDSPVFKKTGGVFRFPIRRESGNPRPNWESENAPFPDSAGSPRRGGPGPGISWSATFRVNLASAWQALQVGSSGRAQWNGEVHPHSLVDAKRFSPKGPCHRRRLAGDFWVWP